MALYPAVMECTSRNAKLQVDWLSIVVHHEGNQSRYPSSALETLNALNPARERTWYRSGVGRRYQIVPLSLQKTGSGSDSDSNTSRYDLPRLCFEVDCCLYFLKELIRIDTCIQELRSELLKSG